MERRDLLKWAGSGVALTSVPMIGAAHPITSASSEALFDIRRYGATGDGKTLDTKAIQSAIDAAEQVGGGAVLFPAGTYASYSIHLKSNVALYPKFQNYFRTHKPPLLAVWGRNDPFFLPPGAEAFKRDIPNAEVRFFETGHFALETHSREIGAAIAAFLANNVK